MSDEKERSVASAGSVAGETRRVWETQAWRVDDATGATWIRLSLREQEVLKSADAVFQKCGLTQHAVVVRDILRRVEGHRIAGR